MSARCATHCEHADATCRTIGVPLRCACANYCGACRSRIHWHRRAQALLAIMDSPLNKAGKVKAVYVSTRSNVLFEVNTKTKLPRTYKRFAGLMVQLLQKLSIRATDGPDKLLRVIKQPVSRHLPAGCRLVGMSHRAGAAQSIYKRAPSIAQKGKPPCAFVVGAFAHGAPDASICVDASYVDEWVSISQYSLSAACVLARICNAMELQWAIL